MMSINHACRVRCQCRPKDSRSLLEDAIEMIGELSDSEILQIETGIDFHAGSNNRIALFTGIALALHCNKN